MIKERTVMYAKELDDVMVLIVELVKVIKNKGDYTELMDELINAINGIDEIDEEYKENLIVAIQTITHRTAEIADVFIKKEEKPVEPTE